MSISTGTVRWWGQERALHRATRCHKLRIQLITQAMLAIWTCRRQCVVVNSTSSIMRAGLQMRINRNPQQVAAYQISMFNLLSSIPKVVTLSRGALRIKNPVPNKKKLEIGNNHQTVIKAIMVYHCIHQIFNTNQLTSRRLVLIFIRLTRKTWCFSASQRFRKFSNTKL